MRAGANEAEQLKFLRQPEARGLISAALSLSGLRVVGHMLSPNGIPGGILVRP